MSKPKKSSCKKDTSKEEILLATAKLQLIREALVIIKNLIDLFLN